MRKNIGFCVGKVTPPGQANVSQYRTWLVQQGQLIHGEITRACTDTVSDNQICVSTVGSGKGVNFFLI